MDLAVLASLALCYTPLRPVAVPAAPVESSMTRLPGPVVPSAILSTLDVPEVLAELAAYAQTAPGHALCRGAELAASADEARLQYVRVAEAMRLLSDPDAVPPFCHKLDLAPTLDALQSEGTLDLQMLAALGDAVSALTELAEWADREPVRAVCPSLAALAAASAPPKRLAERLPSAFVQLPSGGVALSSTAFPLLASRRAAVRGAEKAAEAEMARLLASGELKGLLADPDSGAQRRDGRLVVPVPPQHKRAVGVEVARSRRGATVFVEPHSLLGVSAAARAAAEALATTEARLLRGLCLLVSRELSPLLDAVDSAAELDAVLARAKLGTEIDGIVPHVGTEGHLHLPNACHPLLALRAARGTGAAVGNSIVLQGGRRTSGDAEEGGLAARPQALMLTGPNGGGKSVVLKTAALAAVLCRLGVPLPCAPGAPDGTPARCDFFAGIATDLDDAQSISGGASSFTAHLRSCKAALAAADAADAAGEHLLVILDEPGASTSPVQVLSHFPFLDGPRPKPVVLVLPFL